MLPRFKEPILGQVKVPRIEEAFEEPFTVYCPIKSTFNASFSTSKYPSTILDLPTQTQIDIMYGKSSLMYIIFRHR